MSTYAHELTGDAEYVASTFAQLVSTKVAIGGKATIPGAPAEQRSRVKLLIEKAA
jgi:hypothetical protein